MEQSIESAAHMAQNEPADMERSSGYVRWNEKKEGNGDVWELCGVQCYVGRRDQAAVAVLSPRAQEKALGRPLLGGLLSALECTKYQYRKQTLELAPSAPLNKHSLPLNAPKTRDDP